MNLFDKIRAKLKDFEGAIKIINEIEAEYSVPCNTCNHINGWIPVSERMPEEQDSIFAKFKGTNRWNDSMFEKSSNEVIVTISDKFGKSVTTHAHTNDGKWQADILRINKTYRVIAWQPLPEPFKKVGGV